MKTRENLFRGVNPYLQSLLQTPGTPEQPSLWRSFHTQFIVYLTESLNMQLPSGYQATTEQSLQIWGASEQVAVEATLEPDEMANAVLIYQATEQGILGRLVLRIELLSPSNKEGGEHVQSYKTGRREALLSGIPLLEIDFLHEFASPIAQFPMYPQDKNAYPYYLILSDPRPNLKTGQTSVYGFHVGMPLPALHVPLAAEEKITFDFDPVYQMTYERNQWGNFVDYTDLPVRFSRYHPDDQQRIQTRREEILKTAPPQV